MPKSKLQNTNQSQAGFTLVELLVVTSLTVLLTLAATAIFLTSIITNTKIRMEQKIKAEGNQALSQIKTLIRNSARVNSSQCSAGGQTNTSLVIENLDQGTTTLTLDGNRVASQSAFLGGANTTYYLTTDHNNSPSLTFTCTSGANNSFYIDISLTLQQGTGATSGRETVIETFNGGVAVRNQL
ncbi:MAG: prepilin-type N-terminal cleavage/methylation domain-containing protein [Candidatus Woesebacteria bacterium]|jgi:prepilin-type N-terminal cleavage/methylation domain-containing protein